MIAGNFAVVQISLVFGPADARSPAMSVALTPSTPKLWASKKDNPGVPVELIEIGLQKVQPAGLPTE
jgi:hypothetical protein